MRLRPAVAATILLLLGASITLVLRSPGSVGAGTQSTTFLHRSAATSVGLTLRGNPNAGMSETIGARRQLQLAATSGTNGVIYVDGVTYPRTAAGIQAAITAAPNGGTVYLPTATYTFGVSDSCINVTKPLNIIGFGRGSAISVAAGVGATTDIFCVNPASDGSFIRFSDFEIHAASGTPARYAFHLNGASAIIQNFSIERVVVLQLGSYAIYAEGSGLGQGTPVLTSIEHNVFYGGIVMPNAGDTVRIIDNQITGVGKMDFSFLAGASTLVIKGNNITVDGGIHLGTNVIAAQIIGNEIETFGSFTGSNGSLLDIDGTAGSHAADVTVSENSFQVVNGITANGLRINYADRTNVSGNRFGRGVATSKDILVTANSTAAFIGTNMWVNGTPFTSMVSDAGTNTAFFPEFGGGPLLANNKFFRAIDNAGVQRPIFLMDSAGAVNYYGYHSDNLLTGVNGASYIYDGTGANNIAGAFSNAYPGAAVSGAAKFGGVITAFSTKSSPYTLLSTDRWVNVTGTTTITVPHAATGQSWVVFNSGAATVTVHPDSGKINGAASITLAANTGKEITCDGTNCWAR